MSEIAVEVVTAAEVSYREDCIGDFEWRVERKAQLEEEQRQLELERQERERLQRLEQARIDRLLDEAASLRRAADIRAYVQGVEHAIKGDGSTASAELARWACWALAQADRIDPVKNGRFLQRYEGDESSEE